MPMIVLSNGMRIYAEDSDIEALVETGLLEVTERDEQGKITKAVVTEAGRAYIKAMEAKDKNWN